MHIVNLTYGRVKGGGHQVATLGELEWELRNNAVWVEKNAFLAAPIWQHKTPVLHSGSGLDKIGPKKVKLSVRQVDLTTIFF